MKTLFYFVVSALSAVARGQGGLRHPQLDEGVRSLANVPPTGSYWAVYNTIVAPADDSCLVSEGESVPDSCCVGALLLFPHAAGKEGGNSCFEFTSGLVSFSSCTSDGVAEYGENCLTKNVAASAEECACSLVIEGSGCYKTNDSLGFQWFVYLDGDDCKASGDDGGVDDPVLGAERPTTSQPTTPQPITPRPNTPRPNTPQPTTPRPTLQPTPQSTPLATTTQETIAPEPIDPPQTTVQPTPRPVDPQQTAAPQASTGSYWAVYNTMIAPADDSCLVTEGDSVPDTCCRGALIRFPHAAGKEGGNSCFEFTPGKTSFSSCNTDGVAEYGENCVNKAVAASAEECDCGFVIKGSGCYKTNDMLGFQWFVYLDGSACGDAVQGAERPTAAPQPAPQQPTTPKPVAPPQTTPQPTISQLNAATTPKPIPAPVPPNDLCANAEALPIAYPTLDGSLDSFTKGTTLGATKQDLGRCLAPVTSPGVWYYVIGNGATVTATTCSNETTLDTKLIVYVGGCGGLTCIAGNDDASSCGTNGHASQVSWETTVGTTYHILVHGLATEVGDFAIKAFGSQDQCQYAAPVGGGETVSGSIVDARPPFDGEIDNCNGAAVVGDAPGVWYSVMGTGSDLKVTVCPDVANGRPFKVNVFKSSCEDAKSCIGGDAPFAGCAEHQWSSDFGTPYYILVHNYASPGNGRFDMMVESAGVAVGRQDLFD